MKVENKDIRSLLFLTILFFLVTLISTTYAYFNAKVKGNESAQSIILKTPEIYVEYYKENEIINTDIYTGWNNALSFSIVNVTKEENIPAEYEIKWIIETNEIKNGELLYKLTSQIEKDGKIINPDKYNKSFSIEEETKVPTISTILGKGYVNSGCVHKYTLEMKLIETYENQNYNQDKTFSGYIQVS